MPRRAIPISLLAAVCAVLASGCGTKNKFLGTWDSELKIMGQTLTVTHEFKPDLTYAASVGAVGITATVAGTYSFDSEKLTISGTSLNVKDDGSILAKALVDRARTELEARMKRAQSGKVEWRSDTEFTVQPDETGVPLIVFRKKAS